MLIYSTFLGGTENENNLSINEDPLSIGQPGAGIAVDSAGNAYITGWTRSANFPTQSAAQSYGGGTCGTSPNTYPCPDAFVSKLSASGSTLVYSTFLGGNQSDTGRGLALDSLGQATVTGWTKSANFPTSAASQTLQGTVDGFVMTMSAAGSGRVSSRLLGGSDTDYAYAVALGAGGAIYLTGQTESGDFLPGSPIQATKHGYSDAFIRLRDRLDRLDRPGDGQRLPGDVCWQRL